MAGHWFLITRPEDLTVGFIDALRPRYIFFPHWSWHVPAAVRARSECVCFHMADVPYGRGGSPLQNLIARGHKETKLTALRMVEALDAGPVYGKAPLSLAGRAEDVFARAADLVYDLIAEIVREEPEPTPQTGEVTVFSRRTPQMSALPETGTPEVVYDHIRMLDAPTYPLAFLQHGDFRLEFFDPEFSGDQEVSARVRIRMSNPESREGDT
jgi:methionyl-tRNA formyltransferase